jgi:hypothetical protein
MQYAEYAQKEQDKALDKGIKIPNSVLMKPLTYMFANEYEGGKWRKYMTDKALDKGYYKDINPEVVAAINGQKVVRPSYYYQNQSNT